MLIALLLLGAGALRAHDATSASIPLEYAVKATYLYKLAPFVRWPRAAFATPDAPFVICVVGVDPFHDFLIHAVAERTFGTHPFVVHKLQRLTRDSGCRIAFLGGLHGVRLRRALAAVAHEPVLTVTDSTADARAPSIIHFVIEQGHVRFDVDLKAATRHHLAISSKLLHLAVAVRS